MAHNAEVAEVSYWVTDDGSSFATQAEAEKYEGIVSSNLMSKELPGRMKEHGTKINDSVLELAKEITKASESIEKTKALIRTAQALIKKLEPLGKKLSKDQAAERDQAILDIEDHSVSIDEQTKTIAQHNAKMADIVGFAPILAAFSKHRSRTKYSNDYQCFRAFVLSNTKYFLEWASQAGSFSELKVELNKGGYWDEKLSKSSPVKDDKISIK
jgi:hypothetical protein